MFGLNPWLLLAAVSATLVSFGGGAAIGMNYANGQHAQKEVLIKEVAEAAQTAAAQEIAKLEIKHVTIKRAVEREVRTVPVYSECQHSADGLRLVNEALTNGKPAGDRKLPRISGGAS